MLDVPAHLMLSTVPADRLQVFRLMVDSDSGVIVHASLSQFRGFSERRRGMA
jgi:hypothetical protein